jgi:hypothetical protein
LIPTFLAQHPEHQPHFGPQTATYTGLILLLEWSLAAVPWPQELLPQLYAGLALLRDVQAQTGAP